MTLCSIEKILIVFNAINVNFSIIVLWINIFDISKQKNNKPDTVNNQLIISIIAWCVLSTGSIRNAKEISTRKVNSQIMHNYCMCRVCFFISRLSFGFTHPYSRYNAKIWMGKQTLSQHNVFNVITTLKGDTSYERNTIWINYCDSRSETTKFMLKFHHNSRLISFNSP